MSREPTCCGRSARHAFAWLAAAFLLAGCGDSPADPVHQGPPPCTSVGGTAAVTFSLDAGATLAPTSGVLQGVRYTLGIAGLTSARLLAVHDGNVLISDDAGCNWSQIATVPLATARIERASDTHAYVWQEQSAALYRVSSSGTVVPLTPPVDRISGVWASGARIRVASGAGAIFESANAGGSWLPLGGAVPAAGIFYSVAFDPVNPDHVVAGVSNAGAFVTRNAGQSWTRASIASTSAERNQNVFTLVVSPVDGHTVWASGLDIAEEDAGAETGRHIYLSRDGGETYAVALSQHLGVEVPPEQRVTISNGPPLAAHLTDVDVMYFLFSSSFESYGSDIIEFDAADSSVRVRHHDVLLVKSLAFAPARPETLYLGLSVEQRSEP